MDGYIDHSKIPFPKEDFNLGKTGEEEEIIDGAEEDNVKLSAGSDEEVIEMVCSNDIICLFTMNLC